MDIREPAVVCIGIEDLLDFAAGGRPNFGGKMCGHGTERTKREALPCVQRVSRAVGWKYGRNCPVGQSGGIGLWKAPGVVAEGSDPAIEREGAANGGNLEVARGVDGLADGASEGEIGGDGGGDGASGPVRIGMGDELALEALGEAAVAKDVDGDGGIGEFVSAFDEDRVCAHVAEGARGLHHAFDGGDLADAGEDACLIEVGGDAGGEGHQFVAQGICDFGVKGGGGAFAGHDGVDDEVADGFGAQGVDDEVDEFAGGEHACFGGIDADAIEDGGELGLDDIQSDGIDIVAPFGGGVLSDDAGDGGHAIDTMLLKGFEVGSETCATACIGSCDGEGFGGNKIIHRGYFPNWVSPSVYTFLRDVGGRKIALAYEGRHALFCMQPEGRM